MQLQFCGANREVTGSCHLLITKNKRILVDCGMFQGSDFNAGKNFDDFPFDPKSIDALLVTHAHHDHVGRIPKLVKDGFSGPIYLTHATSELTPLIWEDSFSIMSYDHKKFDYPMLYEHEDIAAAQALFKTVDLGRVIDLGGAVTAVWKDAGHIFGSAFIEIVADGTRIGFSGDIGNNGVPILRETEPLSPVDLLLCESTYGDRLHEPIDSRRKIILDAIKRGVARGGTIMIPAFSLERTQELLYELNTLAEYDHTLPPIPIYVDSPLAIDATKVFAKYHEYYDGEAKQKYLSGDDFFDFPHLELTYTKLESQKLNRVRGAKLVIAGAGMMNGGRIQHHAIRYLPDPNSTILFVGYQAKGTPGRRILDGDKTVTLLRQDIKVQCAVEYVSTLSGHGDQAKLQKWIGTAGDSLKKVYCVHGEEQAAMTFAQLIQDTAKISTYVPEYKEIIDI